MNPDELFKAKTVRFLITYLAVMTTITFIIVGYNQQTVCSTQRQNVENNISINNSIVDAINQQINIYNIILLNQNVIPQKEIKESIKILQKEKEAIESRVPQKPQCLIF